MLKWFGYIKIMDNERFVKSVWGGANVDGIIGVERGSPQGRLRDAMKNEMGESVFNKKKYIV